MQKKTVMVMKTRNKIKEKLGTVLADSVGSFGAMGRFYGVKLPLPAIEVWNHTLGK